MSRFFQITGDFFKKTDKVLWVLTALAVIYSLLLISSMQRAGEYNYMKSQLFAVILGLAASVIIAVADYRYIIKKWYFAAIAAAVLAALVFIFGMRVSGTDDMAWIVLPGGFTIQPSELIKVCFIITFSAHLDYLRRREFLHTLPGVISLLLHAALPMAIIHIQGDDGTVLIFGLIFLIMSFAAGVQLRYFLILFALIAAGAPIIWSFFYERRAPEPNTGTI